MPKSAKKRKDKAADFSKAKLKLGKGKLVASNVIDTSFKARSIVLPTQSIAAEKDVTAPTTRRGLTLNDLLAHLKHYSAGTRKDAIVGLRELLESQWELLNVSLTALISGCVRVIGDEDAGVRKALLTFFSWLLPRIHKEDLVPHSPLLLLFTTSAQTHIFPEIRIDAVRFLNIILDHIPKTVVAGWDGSSNGHGARILEGYLGILNASTKFGETDESLKATSTGSVMLTPGSKLVVLHSLGTFLRHSLSSFFIPDESHTMHAWYLLSSFLNQEAYHSFDELLQPHEGTSHFHDHRYWQPEVELGECGDDFPHMITSPCLAFNDHQTLSDLVNGAAIEELRNGGAIRGTNMVLVVRLARALHPTLVATFLDCAPSVFAPSTAPSDTEVQTIVAVVQIAHSLYGAILQDPALGYSTSVSEDLGNVLGYMSPYFPFRPTGNRDIKREQVFQDLNLLFCELTSLLLLANEQKPVHVARGKARQSKRLSTDLSGAGDALSMQTLRVSEYVVQLLRGESVAMQFGKPLTTAGYLAILPTIWALLNDTTAAHQDMSSDVLKATIEHALKTSSKSALKRLTTEFIARLVLLNTEPHYQGRFRLGRDTKGDQKLEEWVTHLPQTLWELGSSNLLATEIILQFLLRIVHRKSDLIHAKTIASLRSKLTPYFTITHAVRGKLLGPYSRLPTPSRLRRLALDLVATINQGPIRDDALLAAVDTAVNNTEEHDYWVHVRNLLLGSNHDI